MTQSKQQRGETRECYKTTFLRVWTFIPLKFTKPKILIWQRMKLWGGKKNDSAYQSQTPNPSWSKNVKKFQNKKSLWITRRKIFTTISLSKWNKEEICGGDWIILLESQKSNIGSNQMKPTTIIDRIRIESY